MKISEVAEHTGLSISTIRCYETSGLCPAIQRGQDGKRNFLAGDVDWLALRASLRATGMLASQMSAFAELYSFGDKTVPERKVVLMTHRQSLENRRAGLGKCRAILDRKLKKYDEILEDQR